MCVSFGSFWGNVLSSRLKTAKLLAFECDLWSFSGVGNGFECDLWSFSEVGNEFECDLRSFSEVGNGFE